MPNSDSSAFLCWCVVMSSLFDVWRRPFTRMMFSLSLYGHFVSLTISSAKTSGVGIPRPFLTKTPRLREKSHIWRPSIFEILLNILTVKFSKSVTKYSESIFPVQSWWRGFTSQYLKKAMLVCKSPPSGEPCVFWVRSEFGIVGSVLGLLDWKPAVGLLEVGSPGKELDMLILLILLICDIVLGNRYQSVLYKYSRRWSTHASRSWSVRARLLRINKNL